MERESFKARPMARPAAPTMVRKEVVLIPSCPAAAITTTTISISLFTTELDTVDNKRVIVPNSSITSNVITNVTANETRRVDLVIGIGYDDDIKKAKEILQKVVESDDRVLENPKINIAVSELADSSVNFIVRPWVKTPDYWSVYFDLTEKIKLTFDAEGISIPYPQQDVHMYEEKVIEK